MSFDSLLIELRFSTPLLIEFRSSLLVFITAGHCSLITARIFCKILVFGIILQVLMILLFFLYSILAPFCVLNPNFWLSLLMCILILNLFLSISSVSSLSIFIFASLRYFGASRFIRRRRLRRFVATRFC